MVFVLTFSCLSFNDNCSQSLMAEAQVPLQHLNSLSSLIPVGRRRAASCQFIKPESQCPLRQSLRVSINSRHASDARIIESPEQMRAFLYQPEMSSSAF